MADPFYIWTMMYGQKSACSYYRIETPMLSIQDKKLAEIYFEDFNEHRNQKEATLAMLYSDVAHFYSVGGQKFLHTFKTLRNVKPGIRDGRPIYPPALIYDTDDNTDFVHPFNTTFAHLGVRDYPEGKILRPGDSLSFTDRFGKEHVAWEDGVSKYHDFVFNIENNIREMKMRHEMIRMAHGATCTSQPLADYIKNVIGQKNTYVYPNSIRLQDYDMIQAVRKDDRIRILWQGSQSHYVDWWPLHEAVRTIAQKYKDKVTFVIWGELFDWIYEIIPPNMIESHYWTPYDAYKLKRGLLNCDINLCPLVDNPFNACKSAIKWYEGSIWENPEATLAARSTVYSEMIDGENGLLYSTPEEFVEKLSALIENADLRKKVANGAKEYVLNNRLEKHTTEGLFDFYLDTRARQKREMGDPVLAPATLDDMKKLITTLR